MTRTYAGPFKNPTENLRIEPVNDHFIITVKAKYRPEIFEDSRYHADEDISEGESGWNDGE
jgi:hypothetical protein